MAYLTPEEAAALGLPVQAPAPTTLKPEQAAALGLPVDEPPKTFMDKAGDAVNSFFGRGDPKHPTIANPGREIGQQMLKAGAFLVPGSGAASLLGSGALFGAGTSDAQDLGGIAKDTAVGAVTGLVGGKVLQGTANALTRATLAPAASLAAQRAGYQAALDPSKPIIKLVRTSTGPAAAPAAAASNLITTTEPSVGRFAQTVAGPVTPSESAQLLMGKGVRLTRGQQNPASPLNQREEAMTSTWPFGSQIKSQRGVGQQDLQVVALNQALPPGMKPIKVGTEFSSAIDSVDQGFRKAYSSVADIPVYPAVHGPGGGPLQGTSKTPGLVEQAVDSVKRLQDSQRNAIKADVLDVLTKLPPRKGAVGQVDAADLIEARSIIRGRARDLWSDGTAESSAAAEAYEAAEDAITNALRSQLPRSVTKTLEQADKAYANFKIVQKAAISGRSQPGGFTARQLANAASAGRSGVGVGSQDIGPLYDLGLAGADVFQRVSQPTGERIITLSDAGQFMPGWLQRPLQGAAIARGNAQSMSAAPVLVQGPPRRLIPPNMSIQTPQIPGSVPGAVAPQTYSILDAMANAIPRGSLRWVPAGAQQGDNR